MFNVVIIPFQIVVNILVHNVLELVYNWRLWEYAILPRAVQRVLATLGWP